MLVFRTLDKEWLLFLNFSPSGRDQSEGAGGGNPFFRGLLSGRSRGYNGPEFWHGATV